MSDYKWRSDPRNGTVLETMVALHNSQIEELQAEIERLHKLVGRLQDECRNQEFCGQSAGHWMSKAYAYSAMARACVPALKEAGITIDESENKPTTIAEGIRRLVAANARLRALVHAIDTAKAAETICGRPSNIGFVLNAVESARRAVDEAGDLR